MSLSFVWTVLRKDLLRLQRDPFTLLAWLGVPLVLAVLMNLVFGGRQITPQGVLLIADEDRSFGSAMLSGAFGYGDLPKMLVVKKVSRDAGRDVMERGDAAALLVIPAGFQNAALRKQAHVQLILNPAQRVVPKIIQETLEIALHGPPTASSLVRLETTLTAEKAVRSFATAFFPSSMFMAMMLVANSLAGDIWKERTLGTLRRLLVAPVPLGAYLAGRLLFVAAVFAAVAAAGLGAMRWLSRGPIYGIPEAGAWLVLTGVAFYLFLLFLALFATEQRVASVLGNLVIFPLSLVGGCFLPFEVMPAWLADIGRFTPNGWAVLQFRAIVDGSAATSALASGALVMLAASALVSMLVLRRLRSFA
jgi:ABC-type multidrug transport system permease subunit